MGWNQGTTRARLTLRLVLLFAVAIGGALVATPAQAYPDAVCKVEVHARTAADQVTARPNAVRSGAKFTVTGTSNVAHDWTMRFRKQRASGHGETFSHDFRAPKVKKTKTFKVHVACDGGPSQTVDVAVAAAGDDGPEGANGTDENGTGADQDGTEADHNGLPGTGGPALWILLAALALLVAGGVTAKRSRARE